MEHAASSQSDSEIRHANSVACGDSGLLILGQSGSGKSELTLNLIALGATLVADDRTQLERLGDHIRASAPKSIRGLIEARNVGILNAPFQDRVNISYVLDLDRTEAERIPPPRHFTCLGCHLPLLFRANSPSFAATLIHLMRYGRSER